MNLKKIFIIVSNDNKTLMKIYEQYNLFNKHKAKQTEKFLAKKIVLLK